jgi:hypothetical protein
MFLLCFVLVVFDWAGRTGQTSHALHQVIYQQRCVCPSSCVQRSRRQLDLFVMTM